MNQHAYKQIANAVSLLKHRFLSHEQTTQLSVPKYDLFKSIDTFCVAGVISTSTCDYETDESEFVAIGTIVDALNFAYPHHVDVMSSKSIILWANNEMKRIPYFLVYAVAQETQYEALMVDEVMWMTKQILAAAACIDKKLDKAEVEFISDTLTTYADYIRKKGVYGYTNNWDFPPVVMRELATC